MSLPGSHNRVQLFMSYYDQAGNGLAGTVTFRPIVTNTDTADLFTLGTEPVTATLEDGTANLSLLATDDPALSETDWLYEVTELIGSEVRKYRIALPFAAGPVQNLTTTPHLP